MGCRCRSWKGLGERHCVGSVRKLRSDSRVEEPAALFQLTCSGRADSCQSSGLTLPARVPVCPCAASPRERGLAVGFRACSAEKGRIRSWPESSEPGDCWMNADFSRWRLALRRNRGNLALGRCVQPPFMLRGSQGLQTSWRIVLWGCDFLLQCHWCRNTHTRSSLRVVGHGGRPGSAGGAVRLQPLPPAWDCFVLVPHGLLVFGPFIIIHPRSKRRDRQACNARTQI